MIQEDLGWWWWKIVFFVYQGRNRIAMIVDLTYVKCDAQCLCLWVAHWYTGTLVHTAVICDWVIIVSIRIAAAGSCSTPVVSSVQNIINIRWRCTTSCHRVPFIQNHGNMIQHVWSAVTANQVRRAGVLYSVRTSSSTTSMAPHHQVCCLKPAEQNHLVLSADIWSEEV